MRDEKVVQVTLPSGRVVTILDDGKSEIFSRPGRPANFGAVGDSLMPGCQYFFTQLKSGAAVQIFINTETGLISASSHSGSRGQEIRGCLKDGRRFTMEPLAVPA